MVLDLVHFCAMPRCRRMVHSLSLLSIQLPQLQLAPPVPPPLLLRMVTQVLARPGDPLRLPQL
jgi:hypothetical protein